MVIGVHCEARCQFSSSLVYPCDCLHNQIQCYGKKIDENVLTAIFANITAKTDDYLHNLQGLELINTKIKSINSSVLICLFSKILSLFNLLNIYKTFSDVWQCSDKQFSPSKQ